MATAKEIKQRIKSIKNTEKTTKAMELVAAAKMRRAIQAAMSAKDYYNSTWDIVNRVSEQITGTDEKKKQEWKDVLRFFGPELDFDEIPEDEHITLIVFASNRGLCGAYNSHVVKKSFGFIQKRDRSKMDIIVMGTRAGSMLSTLGIEVDEAFIKNDRAQDDESIRLVAAEAYTHFAEGKTDRVLVAYTDFISPIMNEAVIHQLYPLANAVQESVENVDEHSKQMAAAQTEGVQRETALMAVRPDFLYEPTPRRVIEYMIPRIGQIELYQALLQSNASEHSSRMIAMKNATDAAKDMAKALVLEYNRARQAAITREIAEIAAGASALE